MAYFPNLTQDYYVDIDKLHDNMPRLRRSRLERSSRMQKMSVRFSVATDLSREKQAMTDSLLKRLATSVSVMGTRR